MPKTTKEEFILARRRIFESVKAEILGPGSEDVGTDINTEVITDSPLKRYSVGILYPQENKILQENDELICTNEIIASVEGDIDLEYKNNSDNTISKYYVSNGESESEIDEHVNMANQFLPSSMGCTFFTKGNLDRLIVRVKCAKYRTSKYEDCCVNLSEDNSKYLKKPLLEEFFMYKENKLYLRKNLHWKDINRLRETGCFDINQSLSSAIYKLFYQCSDEEARRYGYVRIPLKDNDPIVLEFNDESYVEKVIFNESRLKLIAHKRRYRNDITSFTVMLVNDYSGRANIDNTYFQPELEISSIDNPSLFFAEYLENPYQEGRDEDEESLDLLYKNKKTYATGHGVAVTYDVYEKTGMGCIKTDYMPMYEVPKLNFDIEEINDISEKVLSMKELSDLSSLEKTEQINLLEQFTDAYKIWIKDLKDELKNLDFRYHKAAQRHIENCEEAYQRMIAGIKLIGNDEKVYCAFQLANRAMLMQRVHSKIQNNDRFPDEGKIEAVDYGNVDAKGAKWRSFQLAFIIMSLTSISNPDSPERDFIDLIWVPTGGGKTEAYLGLTAFTIFLRRLKEPIKGGGTAIIMRYTLRLLAAQQFIRASILICACEQIRREGIYNLGKEEISIGLWIGGESTPNTNEKARECYNGLSRSNISNLEYHKSKYNMFQLLKCPWCGTKLTKEIYKNRVKGQWGYMLKTGKVVIGCPEQDCKFDGYLPIKVVDEQIYTNPPTLLFGTVDKFAMMTWKAEVSRLFALDYMNDNKSPELIIQDELHLISGPLGTIVGLYETAIDAMCSSKGEKPKIIASTATIRRADEQCRNLYARSVKQFPAPGLSSEDSFFTREITVDKEPGRLYAGIMASGKTQTTVEIRLMAALLQNVYNLDMEDHVKDKYWSLVGYFNSIRELGKCSTLVDDDIKDAMRRLANRLNLPTRLIFESDELTGRIPSGQITKTLEKLEVEYSKENIDKKQYAVNVLLASNMISVGVDVSRLNLMLVVGQPKLTSEYIQASSRVGRTFPGLVFTLYDGSKSRDRSHFEKFYPYHQSFYKYVEPTSVTPFAEPARDRALHALLISMIRHIGGLNAEEAAEAFDYESEVAKQSLELIVNRIRQIDKSLEDETRYQIEKIYRLWHEKIDSLNPGEILTYTKENHKHLIKPFGKISKDSSFQTLQAMRNVDSHSGVHILLTGDDKNEHAQ